MPDEFIEHAWTFHGDRTALERLERVLDHYEVDRWTTADTLRFVTGSEEVVEYAEKALQGTVLEVERVRACGDQARHRVQT